MAFLCVVKVETVQEMNIRSLKRLLANLIQIWPLLKKALDRVPLLAMHFSYLHAKELWYFGTMNEFLQSHFSDPLRVIRDTWHTIYVSESDIFVKGSFCNLTSQIEERNTDLQMKQMSFHAISDSHPFEAIDNSHPLAYEVSTLTKTYA